MFTTASAHIPVLLDECIQALVTDLEGTYLDGTFGRGGHSTALLNALDAKARLIAFDKDSEAIAWARKQFAEEKRFTIVHASFAQMQRYLASMGIHQVDGILLDLGVSSPQLAQPERGFSFYEEGYLDMRMDTTQGITAAEWLANVSERELAEVLWRYGEERYARRIARAIVDTRAQNPLTTTQQLADLVAKACPTREKHKHPATRTFQAIRIFINDELNELAKGLAQGLTLLRPGGRMAVISFHSLEDRIVKQFIRSKSQGPVLPKEIPVMPTHFIPELRKVGPPIRPTATEVQRNPRARSATLRVMEKRV